MVLSPGLRALEKVCIIGRLSVDIVAGEKISTTCASEGSNLAIVQRRGSVTVLVIVKTTGMLRYLNVHWDCLVHTHPSLVCIVNDSS